MEYGIITSYSSTTDKGIVSGLDENGIPSGQNLPFIGDNVHRLAVVSGDVLFMSRKQERATYTCEPFPPQVGDRIVFLRRSKSRAAAVKVAKWAPMSEMEYCQQIIADTFPMYRLVKTNRTRHGSCSGPVWHGRGVLELSAMYPWYYSHGKLVDQLAPSPSQSYRIERQDGGDWHACKDPRVVFHLVPTEIRTRFGQHVQLPSPVAIPG